MSLAECPDCHLWHHHSFVSAGRCPVRELPPEPPADLSPAALDALEAYALAGFTVSSATALALIGELRRLADHPIGPHRGRVAGVPQGGVRFTDS
jgi:hypothetical protein